MSTQQAQFARSFAQNISGTCNRNISDTGTSYSQNPAPNSVCANCVRAPLLSPVTSVVAPLAYAGCAAIMVQQQKQREGAVASRVLAELLGDAVLVRHSNRATHRMPDTLIPVPLHWRREGQRGHNQSALLAAHLGRRLHIPVGLNIAHRSRATASQQQLNIAARTVNMANAFQITGTDAAGQHPELRNTCIAIIDDVVTTGATARALAQSLQSAGAAEVHLWSPTRAILAPDDS